MRLKTGRNPPLLAGPRSKYRLGWINVWCWLWLAVVVGPIRGAEADPAVNPFRTDATYWAYRPVMRPAIPTEQAVRPAANPIDAFIQRRLSAEGLSLSPPAGKYELLRRAKFDLHGLPPTPDEIDEFAADQSEDAYTRLLDRLLASPHYGERWGRHWLDVVRYADSAGYNADPVRPLAYRYRDYVIQAFNADLPYDRFVQQQLAGDELFPDDEAALVATGFLRLQPDESNASNVLLARQDQLNDLTGVVGSALLGQSLACAQCHDHKFDDLPQRDFYRLQAFFAAVVPADQAMLGTPEELRTRLAAIDRWKAAVDPLREELRQLELPARIAIGGERRLKFPSAVLASIDLHPSRRSSLQQQFAFFAERQIPITEAELLKKLSAEQQSRRQQLLLQIEEMEAARPAGRDTDVMAGIDGPHPPTTYLLSGGSYEWPEEEVAPGFLSAISADPAAAATIPPPLRPGSSGRRAALARWITDARNPLTARVMANRLWQGHFGRGLVQNGNDLGVQGGEPLYAELLDWLSAELVTPTWQAESATVPWSLKRMHRLIMTSCVYLQSSRAATQEPIATTYSADPTNRWYWRFPRRRLEAESVRDSLLAVSGLLNPRMHGPGICPPLPPGYSSRESWTVSPDLADRCRRSVYILAKRNLPYPLLGAFDLPDMHESCACRQMTTTSPQALTLLNSHLVLSYAQAFAGRLLADDPMLSPMRQVDKACLLAFGRPATAAEQHAGGQFLSDQTAAIAARTAQGADVLLPTPFPKFYDPAQGAALVDFCHALMNSNEFLYVD
ncbi:MAG: DUF1549 domain-containing protein [Pirellulales bacterium]